MLFDLETNPAVRNCYYHCFMHKEAESTWGFKDLSKVFQLIDEGRH
jgi:uncharacterized 2Fe-2S/4Fe-4S cluster protein (DUF4445 family)